MPDPPSTSVFTRRVLEQPLPVVLFLLTIALVIGWTALRDGRRDRLVAAAVPGVLGVAVFLAGTFVTTAGEHAEAVVRRFVDAAVAGDPGRAVAVLADDAAIAVGSVSSPGLPRVLIERRLEDLASGPSVDNSITGLSGYTVSGDRAVVHLHCHTEVEGGSRGWGMARTSWVMDVERDAAGDWLIGRLTCITINGRNATSELVTSTRW